MKNADMPAMPVITDSGERVDSSSGLTKREEAAFRAMQGLLANPQSTILFWADEDGAQLEQAAINHADALLAELEKTNS